MILTDEELNAAILESGWTTRGKEAVKEFHALAKSIEVRVMRKLMDNAHITNKEAGVLRGS